MDKAIAGKSLFIAGVEALKVEGDLGRGDRFGEIFFLTNNPDVIRGLLPPFFQISAGSLEYSYLLSGKPVVYALEDYHPTDSTDAIKHLSLRIAQLSYFLHLLWYTKDNSAHMEFGYLLADLNTAALGVHRNFRGVLKTNSQGKMDPVTFSREELRQARLFFGKFKQPPCGASPQVMVEALGRWVRADYFVQAARSNADIGVKIANYCTALEGLFSTDNQELSHKLAERIAIFLAESPKRSELYRSIKRAYAIRSKVVHGGRGGPNLLDQAMEVSGLCDDVCRDALLKIYSEPELHDQFINGKAGTDLEEYFLKRLLGE
ncbi:hypothetical protein KKH27_08635 [bacterium]|nr:hypothetical protein [bacterium]